MNKLNNILGSKVFFLGSKKLSNIYIVPLISNLTCTIVKMSLVLMLLITGLNIFLVPINISICYFNCPKNFFNFIPKKI